MLILPAIDLKDGACVRLSQGEKDKVKVYNSNPLAVAEGFVLAGAKMLHIVDLDGAFVGEQTKNLMVVRNICNELNVPIQFGGGVRQEQVVASLLEMGVSRIVLGTIAIESPELLKTLVRNYAKYLAVGIDARNGKVATRGWTHTTTVDAINLAKEMAEMGIERVVYTDIAQDGMLKGPNIEMTQKLAQATKLKITASGGISCLADISNLKNLEKDGVDSCIIGKALYEERFTLAQALAIT
jgi:phosphoribosylformimino-5-aminoimidazole carboxamide ribotide isomerase